MLMFFRPTTTVLVLIPYLLSLLLFRHYLNNPSNPNTTTRTKHLNSTIRTIYICNKYKMIMKQFQQCFHTALRLSRPKKELRVTVHVNSNDALEAMNQAVNLYKATKLELERQKEAVDPVFCY